MNAGGLLGIFALMVLIELPDKTMIATIVMSTRARASSIVAGASSAFVLQMAIAVVAGRLLSLLPRTPKNILVGLLFLAGAAYLLLSREATAEAAGAREGARESAASRWREIATAFGVIFVSEFGDLSQIQAANFTARTHDPWGVFVAASLALIGVSFLGAYGGRALRRVVPLAWIRYGAGTIFAGLGIYTLATL